MLVVDEGALDLAPFSQRLPSPAWWQMTNRIVRIQGNTSRADLVNITSDFVLSPEPANYSE
jgi:hypothetical protein